MANKKFDRNSSVVKRLKRGSPTQEFDDDSRTITWVMTTETLDRDNETVDPEGGEFDDYMRNPTVQFNHETDDFPIGRLVGEPWNDYIGEGTKYSSVGGKKRMALLGKVQFSLENPKGDLAYRQAKEGTLKGGSISFLPAGPVTRNPHGGNHYGKWKLLEFTVCPVGSNPDSVALTKALRPEKGLAKKDGYWIETVDVGGQHQWAVYHGPRSTAEATGFAADRDAAEGEARKWIADRKNTHPFEVREEDGEWFVFDDGEAVCGPHASEEEAESEASALWDKQEREVERETKARRQPSSNIDPGKARQILRDGEVRGHKLTEAQRGMFGAAAGRKARDKPKIGRRLPPPRSGIAQVPGFASTVDDLEMLEEHAPEELRRWREAVMAHYGSGMSIDQRTIHRRELGEAYEALRHRYEALKKRDKVRRIRPLSDVRPFEIGQMVYSRGTVVGRDGKLFARSGDKLTIVSTEPYIAENAEGELREVSSAEVRKAFDNPLEHDCIEVTMPIDPRDARRHGLVAEYIGGDQYRLCGSQARLENYLNHVGGNMRKVWVKGRKAWLRKSEGAPSEGMKQYLEDRGLDDVTVGDEDKPPEGYEQLSVEGSVGRHPIRVTVEIDKKRKSEAHGFEEGDRVRTPDGDGEVIYVNGDDVEVKLDGGAVRVFYGDQLVKKGGGYIHGYQKPRMPKRKVDGYIHGYQKPRMPKRKAGEEAANFFAYDDADESWGWFEDVGIPADEAPKPPAPPPGGWDDHHMVWDAHQRSWFDGRKSWGRRKSKEMDSDLWHGMHRNPIGRDAADAVERGASRKPPENLNEDDAETWLHYYDSYKASLDKSGGNMKSRHRKRYAAVPERGGKYSVTRDGKTLFKGLEKSVAEERVKRYEKDNQGRSDANFRGPGGDRVMGRGTPRQHERIDPSRRLGPGSLYPVIARHPETLRNRGERIDPDKKLGPGSLYDVIVKPGRKKGVSVQVDPKASKDGDTRYQIVGDDGKPMHEALSRADADAKLRETQSKRAKPKRKVASLETVLEVADDLEAAAVRLRDEGEDEELIEEAVKSIRKRRRKKLAAEEADGLAEDLEMVAARLREEGAGEEEVERALEKRRAAAAAKEKVAKAAEFLDEVSMSASPLVAAGARYHSEELKRQFKEEAKEKELTEDEERQVRQGLEDMKKAMDGVRSSVYRQTGKRV